MGKGGAPRSGSGSPRTVVASPGKEGAKDVVHSAPLLVLRGAPSSAVVAGFDEGSVQCEEGLSGQGEKPAQDSINDGHDGTCSEVAHQS